jgi:hypothetical protein
MVGGARRWVTVSHGVIGSLCGGEKCGWKLVIGGPAQSTPNFQMAPTPKKLIRIVECTHLMVVLKFHEKNWPLHALLAAESGVDGLAYCRGSTLSIRIRKNRNTFIVLTNLLRKTCTPPQTSIIHHSSLQHTAHSTQHPSHLPRISSTSTITTIIIITAQSPVVWCVWDDSFVDESDTCDSLWIQSNKILGAAIHSKTPSALDKCPNTTRFSISLADGHMKLHVVFCECGGFTLLMC